MQTIKYTGTVSPWTDDLTGSGITWTTGQVEAVPDTVAQAAGGYPSIFQRLRVGAELLPGPQAGAMLRGIGDYRRTLLAEAARSAINRAADWAATTAYVATDIRKLPTGELIICTTGGTSGASAPTYSGSAAMTDGTVTWWTLAMVSGAVTCPFTVVVADNSGTTAAVFKNLHTDTGSFDQPCTPNAYTPGGSGNTTRSTPWAWIDGSAIDNGFGANGRDAKTRSVVFSTNSANIEIGYYSIAANYVNERVRVWIDGWEVAEGLLVPGANGASRYWRLSVQGPRISRRVRIVAPGPLALTYVGVDANCSIQRHPVDEPVSWWFTDSYGNTESPVIALGPRDLCPTASLAAGIPHCMALTIGGTSYTIANGARLGLTALLKKQAFGAQRCDVMVVCHGFNAGASGSGVTTATEAANALAAWRALRALRSAPILVTGPWWTSTVNAATMPAMGAALKAQFLVWADPNSAYIDPLDGSITSGTGEVIQAAAGAWITQGVESTWAIGADTVHPSPAGRAYLATTMGRAIDAALRALGS